MDITILWESEEDDTKTFFGVFSNHKKALAFEEFLNTTDKYNWYAEECYTNATSLQEVIDYHRRFNGNQYRKPVTSTKHDVILNTYFEKYDKFFLEYSDEKL